MITLIPAKRLLNALYEKTSRIRRKPTHQILVCEQYFAACLFKQLGFNFYLY